MWLRSPKGRHLVLAAVVGLAASVAGIVASPLAMLAIIGAGVSFTIIVRPSLGVYGAVLVAPLHVYRHGVGPFNISLFRIVVLLTAFAVLIHLILGTRFVQRRLPPRAVLFTALLFVFYLLFVAVQSQRSITGLGATILGQRTFFLVSILVLTGAIVALRMDRDDLLRVGVVSAVGPLLLAVHQWATGNPATSLPFQELIGNGGLDLMRSSVPAYGAEGLRPAATFSDPNFLGVFCVLTVAAADVARRHGSRGWRWGAMVVAMMSVGVIVITGSRTGLIGLVAYVLLTRAAQRTTRRWLVLMGTALALTALFALVAIPDLGGKVGAFNRFGSTATHYETRAAAVGVGIHHPWTGVGTGNLGLLLGEPPDRSSAHSLPFTVFAEEGVPGVLLLLAALSYPFFVSLRRDGLGEAIGPVAALFIPMLLYDFVFVLDVAAIWWAYGLAAPRSLTATRATQRLPKLRTASRRLGDSATATPA